MMNIQSADQGKAQSIGKKRTQKPEDKYYTSEPKENAEYQESNRFLKQKPAQPGNLRTQANQLLPLFFSVFCGRSYYSNGNQSNQHQRHNPYHLHTLLHVVRRFIRIEKFVPDIFL